MKAFKIEHPSTFALDSRGHLAAHVDRESPGCVHLEQIKGDAYKPVDTGLTRCVMLRFALNGNMLVVCGEHDDKAVVVHYWVKSGPDVKAGDELLMDRGRVVIGTTHELSKLHDIAGHDRATVILWKGEVTLVTDIGQAEPRRGRVALDDLVDEHIGFDRHSRVDFVNSTQVLVRVPTGGGLLDIDDFNRAPNPT